MRHEQSRCAILRSDPSCEQTPLSIGTDRLEPHSARTWSADVGSGIPRLAMIGRTPGAKRVRRVLLAGRAYAGSNYDRVCRECEPGPPVIAERKHRSLRDRHRRRLVVRIVDGVPGAEYNSHVAPIRRNLRLLVSEIGI